MSDKFDGCRRDCRTAGTHTLVWGDCEQGVEPPPPAPVVPAVSLSDDGCMSIGYEPYDLAGHDAEVRAAVFAEVRAKLLAIAEEFAAERPGRSSYDATGVRYLADLIAPKSVEEPS